MSAAEQSPEALSLAELDLHCRRETQRYRQGQPSDPRYCLAIFQRALRLTTSAAGDRVAFADEEARELLVRHYTSFIEATLSRKGIYGAYIEDLTQQVWMRFWSAAAGGLIFKSLEEALSYLRLTTVRTQIEQQRQQRKRQHDESIQQQSEQSGDTMALDSGIDLFSDYVRKRFRERCSEIINEATELHIFTLRYGMGLPPRVIAAELASEGVVLRGKVPTPRAVSDTLERIFKRLRQDPDIQDLIRED